MGIDKNSLLYARQCQGECGSCPRCAVNLDFAVVFLDYLMCYCQAETGTSIFGGKEWIENFFSGRLVHANTGVGELN